MQGVKGLKNIKTIMKEVTNEGFKIFKYGNLIYG